MDSGSNYGVDLDNQHSTMWGIGFEDTLKVGGGVKLKTVDLTISLESLSYFLAQPTNSNGKK